jgi:hypothetical protein
VKRGGGVIQTAVPYADNLDNNNTLVLNGRDMPGDGSGNWKAWYDELKRAGGTSVIKNEIGDGGSNTAVAAITWGDSPAAIVVQELSGCIAVMCYSIVGKSTLPPHRKPRDSVARKHSESIQDYSLPNNACLPNSLQPMWFLL